MQDKEADLVMMIAKGAEAINLLEALAGLADEHNIRQAEVHQRYRDENTRINERFVTDCLTAVRNAKRRVDELEPTDEDIAELDRL